MTLSPLTFLILTLFTLSYSHPDTFPLISFKLSLNSPKNALSTWSVNSSPCTWTGIHCSLNRVHKISLPNMYLSGSLVPLLNLSHLHFLSLENNNFTGKLPSFATLNNLKHLFLSKNGFSGNVPGLPSNIIRVDLSFNSLTGLVPDLTALNKLEHLFLSKNGFTGNVPGLPSNVVRVDLSFNDLSGEIPSLTMLSKLEHLDLSKNGFSGKMPSLPGDVISVDLSFNELSGEMPNEINLLSRLVILRLENNKLSGEISSISSITSLQDFNVSSNGFSGPIPVFPVSIVWVDLSYNDLTGSVPKELNLLTRLVSLRLEHNKLSGEIGNVSIASLVDFNVSYNGFYGEIPKSLSGFSKTSYEGNVGLCGAPLGECRGFSSEPNRPGVTVKKGGKGMGKVVIGLIVFGDVLVLFCILGFIYCCFWKRVAGRSREMGENEEKVGFCCFRKRGKARKMRDIGETEGGKSESCCFRKSHVEKTSRMGENEAGEGGKIVYSSMVAQPGFERGKMVFFEGVRRFELEDLLRASAEMLGKGGSGTAYKAVMEDGDDVAVKRMKDGSGGKREFEMQMEVIGRIRHENVVALRAYYFAKDEKLLVYDYMPNGSLFWLLHGNRGPGRTPLDWTTRLKIVAGAARGLVFIHNAKLTHGNIKSTNVLLDKSGNARVSDFGLSMFSPPSSFSSKSNGYRAPESVDPRKITQKSDVYSFGVLLLELLTGKCPTMGDNVGSMMGNSGVVDLPRWVQSVVREEWTAEVFDLELMRYKDIEEEMVGLLQIAMACTLNVPNQRPKMSQVVKMIEEIRGVEMSPSHDATDSVSDSPSVSEDTCGVSQ